MLRHAGASSIGVGTVSTDAKQVIPFYIYAPIQMPAGPIKSVLYSEKPLRSQLTEGNTHSYEFASEWDYQKVCRQIEQDWYVCIDYED